MSRCQLQVDCIGPLRWVSHFIFANCDSIQLCSSIYVVDFEGDSCSCTLPPSCCKEMYPTAECAAGPARMQRIEVMDRSSGSLVAPGQSVTEFKQGRYLRFKLRGSVVLRVRQLCSQRGDAMINALFWDDT